jgi:HK97 family phage major capsid protein
MTTTLLDSARSDLESVKARYSGSDYEARIAAANTVAEVDQLEAEARDAVSIAQKRYDSITRSAEARSNNPILAAGGLGDFRVTSEPATYSPHNLERSYFADLFAARTSNDQAALARLQRNNAEVVEARTKAGAEARTVLTTTDFYPPNYLSSLFVTSHRARQVFAGLVQQLPLPPTGETVTIPAYVGPTDAANPQAGDNQAITSNAGTTSQLSGPITTWSGYTDVSRQWVERGAPGGDEVIFGDISRDIARKIEIACLNGSGTNQPKGILHEGDVPAVTVGGQTAAQLLLKLADLMQRIEVAVGEPADFILMHSRRFSWLSSLLDDQHRPIIVPSAQGPYNAFGTFAQQQSEDGLSLAPDIKPAGSMLGMNIYTSPSLPTTSGAGTNEDPCVVGVSHLAVRWYDPNGIRHFSFEGVASATGSIRLQGWTYGAFLTRYPTGFGIVNGMTTPSF